MKHHSFIKNISNHYDTLQPIYESVLGNVIQGSRTTNVTVLLDYIINSSGMKNGFTILDAGCGVCGPSIYFTENLDVRIEAINISAKQIETAIEKIDNAGLSNKIGVRYADFHDIGNMFDKQTFDMVVFLESISHVIDPNTLIKAISQILKPGGILYIKDIFLIDEMKGINYRTYKKIKKSVNKHYNAVLNEKNNEINNFIMLLINGGFKIDFCRHPQYENDHYYSQSTFQKIANIDLKGTINEVFKVINYFEIRAIKI